MKDVLSAAAFAMKAVCFVVFLITLKPGPLSAVTAPDQPAHWSVESTFLKKFAEAINGKEHERGDQ